MMKKIILPILLATMVSCSKTEIKEIETIVEVETYVDAVWLSIDEAMFSYSDQEKTDEYNRFLGLLKDYIQNDGSEYQGHYFYVGGRAPSGGDWIYANSITVLSEQNFLVKNVRGFYEGFDNLKIDENQKPLVNGSLEINDFFYENKFIGYLSKQQILNLKSR